MTLYTIGYRPSYRPHLGKPDFAKASGGFAAKTIQEAEGLIPGWCRIRGGQDPSDYGIYELEDAPTRTVFHDDLGYVDVLTEPASILGEVPRP